MKCQVIALGLWSQSRIFVSAQVVLCGAWTYAGAMPESASNKSSTVAIMRVTDLLA